jgi:hypothetical protein
MHIDLDELQTISDCIDAVFEQETSEYFRKIEYIFWCFHVLPFLIQLFWLNELQNEDFHTNASSVVIKVCCVLISLS